MEDSIGDHTESSFPINLEDEGKAFKGGQAYIKREATLKELPKIVLWVAKKRRKWKPRSPGKQSFHLYP